MSNGFIPTRRGNRCRCYGNTTSKCRQKGTLDRVINGCHANLWCRQRDRFIRHLSKYQLRSFEQYLPQHLPGLGQQLALMPSGGETWN